MALAYRQVKDLYDMLHDAGAVSKTLPEWSGDMNDLTGSDLYSEGLHDNFVKHASVGVDRMLESIPGLIPASREFGRGFGGVFGHPEEGASIGEGLPRMAANFLPVVAAEVATGGGATFPLLGAAGLGGTAALSGAETYTATDSPAAGLLSGATAAALPWATGKIEQGILGKLGSRAVSGPLASSFSPEGFAQGISNVSRNFANNPLQSGLASLGGQVGAAGIMEASGLGQDILAGRDLHNPFSAETALNLTLGQLPFAALHLGGKALGFGKSPSEHANALQHAIDLTKSGLERRQAYEVANAKTPIEQVPDVSPNGPSSNIDVGAITEETNKKLAELGALRKPIEENPTAENITQLQAIHDEEAKVISDAVSANGGKGLGLADPNKDRIPIKGENLFYKPETGYHVITVSDHPDNAGLTYPDGSPIQPGDRIGFPSSKYNEPEINTDKSPDFLLPSKGQFSKVPDNKETISQARVDAKAELESVKQIVSTTSSYGEAVNQLKQVNEIRETYGLKQIDLARLRKEAKEKGLVDVKSALTSVADETKHEIEIQEKVDVEQKQAQEEFEQRLGISAQYKADLDSRTKDGDSLAIQINQLRDKFSKIGGGGSNYNKLVDYGIFDETAKKWEEAGGTNIEELKGKFSHAIQTGAGLSDPYTKIFREAKEKDPIASKAVQNKFTEAAYTAIRQSISDVPSKEIANDAKQFVSLIKEFGTLTDVTPEELGEFLVNESKDEFGSGKEYDDQGNVKQVAAELGSGLNHIEAKEIAEEFLAKPHVKEWIGKQQEELDKIVSQNEQGQKRLAPKENLLPAGGPFVFGMDKYDEERNTFAGKPVAKSGILPVAALKSLGGRGKPLQDVEIDMMKAIDKATGGEAFDGNGNVNLKKLVKTLKENPVQVEVKKLGDESSNFSSKRQKYSQLQHELETLVPNFIQHTDSMMEKYSPEIQNKYKEYRKLGQELTTTQHDSNETGGKYKFLGPKSEQDMPGYVEGLVRIPKKDASYTDWSGQKVKQDGPYFSGPHFGNEDSNVLAFFRGFEETFPDGQKAFHLIEVQSDWGQARKKAEKQLGTNMQEVGGQRPWSAEDEVKGHPLLSSYETLALKAAIDHANSIGATKIILPDAETAMMTEGHDKQQLIKGPFDSKEERLKAQVELEKKFSDGVREAFIPITKDGKEYIQLASNGKVSNEELLAEGFKVPQEGGMRLHYDTTLPSVMRKLTGEKGERFEGDTHKTAYNVRTVQDIEAGIPAGNINGSPVFKNPDGSSKSSISGAVYDLSKAKETQSSQGGFTLGDPSRAPKEIQTTPYLPSDKELPLVTSLTGDGHKLLEDLGTSSNPLYRQLAQEWKEKYPELLSRMDSSVQEANGAYAQGIGEKMKIVFTPSELGLSREDFESIKIHEMTHGLTEMLLSKLSKNDPLRVKLEEIRQKGISALPKELKASWDKLGDPDSWMEVYSSPEDAWTRKVTYSDGSVKYFSNDRAAAEDNTHWPATEVSQEFIAVEDLYKNLAPTAKGRSILYALMNHSEMNAQVYSSKDFRDFLKGVPGKTSAWRSFVNWTKELLGLDPKFPDNALNDLIDTSSQLMAKGEFLANAQNYGERYFEGQGKGGTYGKAQTTRGLQLIGKSIEGISQEEITRALTESEGKFNPALDRATRKVEKLISEKTEDFQDLSEILDELGHDPSRRGIDDLIETSLSDHKDIQDVIDNLPQEVNEYIFQKLIDHKDVLGFVDSATKVSNSDLLNVAKPELLRTPIAQTLSAISKILKNQERQQDFAKQLIGMMGITPDGYLGRAAAAPKIISDFVNGTKEKGDDFISWFAKVFESNAQKVRRLPDAAELSTHIYQQSTNARKIEDYALKPFSTDNSSDVLSGESSKEKIKKTEKVLENSKLKQAATDYMIANNVVGRATGETKMLPENHEKIQKIKNRLKPDEWKQVVDFVNDQGISTQNLQRQTLEYFTQTAAMRGAGVAGLDTGFKVKENLALSDGLLRGILKLKDPMTQWQGQKEIETIQQKFGLIGKPDGFLNLLNYVSGEAEKLSIMKEEFDKNPFWATAQRLEQYLVHGRKNGKIWQGQASSTKEGQAIAEKLGVVLDKEKPFTDQWAGAEEDSPIFANFSPERIEKLREIEGRGLTILQNGGFIPKTKEAEDAYWRASTVNQALREDVGGNSIRAKDLSLPPRTFSKGSEDIDWVWNHIAYAKKQANFLSKMLLRAQAQTVLAGPELATNPELRTDLAQHLDNYLTPDPRLAKNLTKLNSVWFMGFNLASSLINMAQPFVTHVGELTSLTGKPLDSYRRVLSALKEAGDIRFGNHNWGTEEKIKFMKDAALDGQRGYSKFDDDAQANESAATDFRRAMNKEKTQSLGQRLGTLGGNYSDASMKVFKMGEQLNSDIALLSGFDYYREQGLNYEDAKAKAYEYNRAVNYSGGRAQRPVGLFSGRGPTLRTAAMLGTSLQGYTLGTMGQIARYMQKGLFRPPGSTPAEVYKARLALGQMLGTQFAAAGLLGMPFVSGAIALLDKTFPELELNRKLREGIGSFLQSDSENGHILTDIATTGLPSMLGWDLQSRLSMGNTLPGVSEVNGFQPENLLGPTANLVRNFVGGVQGWTKGDLSASAKFVPKGLMNFVNAGQKVLTNDSSIQDYQGRPITNPSLGENLGLALGFQPKRLSDQNAASRILSQSQKNISEASARTNQDLASEILKGNFGTVRSAILAKAQVDKYYNPVDAAKSVARASEELSFPRDLRSEGSSRTSPVRQNLLSSFSNLSGVSSPSEEQRFLFRQQVEQKLGVPPGREGNELLMARTIDQLHQSNPSVSRADLKIQAASLLRRRAQTQTQTLLQE